MSAARSTTGKTPDLELSGILATTDTYERLRLCLVDGLTPVVGSGQLVSDNSWARLRRAVPESDAHQIPYNLPLGGAPDDAGIRGECWVTISGRKSPEKKRILALAEDLRGKEVILTVLPKRYSFISQAGHNKGEGVSGVSLQFVSLGLKIPPAHNI